MMKYIDLSMPDITLINISLIIMNKRIYIYIYICVCVYIYIYIYVYIYMLIYHYLVNSLTSVGNY